MFLHLLRAEKSFGNGSAKFPLLKRVEINLLKKKMQRKGYYERNQDIVTELIDAVSDCSASRRLSRMIFKIKEKDKLPDLLYDFSQD